MVQAVVGLNWGDEGKGRMVDYFASQADCVVRYQGGNNAGHTVINDKGKFAFHNFPSGICFDNVINMIASGSVVNPEAFMAEQNELKERGLPADNIMISDRATLIMPYHMVIEKLEEERLGDRKYGSTMSGIAPSYADKYQKKSLQAGDLLHPKQLREKLEHIIEYKNLIITGVYGARALDIEDIWSWLMKHTEKMKEYVKDIQPVISKLLKEDKNIIVEAQLGALRDVSLGIYPYTTSSSVLAGYACASIPIPGREMKEVIGITKAYSTCVGEGPFVTEIFDAQADEIRKIGKEYGATTGRPRRIGHFDAVATRYGAEVQGATQLVITCLDVLSGQEKLKIATGYETSEGVIDYFPINAILDTAKPVYEEMNGWHEDITGARKFEDLPENAQYYVQRIEALVGVKATYISVGPERDALIIR